ncbi:MAG: DNA-processing protein DprA [Candidatus Liptonbacteria bacterium]|nr:DNA-processing protein DprA [Candidatus Liptonbacteria bacterium]
MPQKIREIRLKDKDFPAVLREIHNPPAQIFVWSKSGDLPDLGSRHPSGCREPRWLSIVGTRRCSAYGEEILRKIVAGLSSYGFGTVSGMAIGIDTVAADASLINKIPTIAVLGSGLGKEAFYPKVNWRLAEKIVEEGGAVISEYEPEFMATQYSFPQRNRIISGLSPATLVVEAPEKSGALITAKFALDQNRDVLAVPGSAFGANSLGTNRLIKQGAGLVTEADDVLKAYGLELSNPGATSGSVAQGARVAELNLSPEENQIFEILTEPMDIDSLIRKSKMPARTAMGIIGLMEIRGIIKKLGNEYIKQ